MKVYDLIEINELFNIMDFDVVFLKSNKEYKLKFVVHHTERKVVLKLLE